MKEEKEKDYYSLKTKAVDDLIEASRGDAPEYSEKELKAYRSKGGLNLPNWFKMIGIKFWFGGAVCFFFIWGLGIYLQSMLDLLVITALAMGFVTDLLVNGVIRFLSETEGSNDKWMMFGKKGYMSLVLNVFYCFLIMFCVFMAYNMVNYLILSLTGQENVIPVGVEPITFGLLYMGFDMLFVSMKNLAKGILRDARRNAKGE